MERRIVEQHIVVVDQTVSLLRSFRYSRSNIDVADKWVLDGLAFSDDFCAMQQCIIASYYRSTEYLSQCRAGKALFDRYLILCRIARRSVRVTGLNLESFFLFSCTWRTILNSDHYNWCVGLSRALLAGSSPCCQSAVSSVKFGNQRWCQCMLSILLVIRSMYLRRIYFTWIRKAA